MPFSEGMLTDITGVAGVDLSKSQFYAVTAVNDASSPVPGTHLALAAAGKNCSGILQDNPIAGQAGLVRTSGTTIAAISANQAIVAGTTLLQVDTGGTLTPVSTGTPVAQALESIPSSAGIALISVRLLPSNAAFS